MAVKDGREVWRICWALGRNASGKYRYGNMVVHGTRDEAKKKLREILGKRDKDVPVEPARETVKAFLERWLRDYKATLSPTTRASYKHIIDAHLIPGFGSLRLNQVTPQRPQAYTRRNPLPHESALPCHGASRRFSAGHEGRAPRR